MNDLISIPCVLMRGGTSKGPFFLASDLPESVASRDSILIAGLGAGHTLQIDGIGGGNPVSSKVAIISPSEHPDADVDYLFAQVGVTERVVDISPNCGNMLSAVGPFAIEAGLVRAGDPVTRIRIRNVNTNSLVEAEVSSPGGIIAYRGTASIDGVPDSAAPIFLTFLDALARSPEQLFPSGRRTEVIDGVEVTCIQSAMTMIIINAADLGVTGHEGAKELDSNTALLERIERMRREAGLRMNLGDVSGKVIPKPVIIAPPERDGHLAVRYFMPHSCHPALATTGAIALGVAAMMPDTLVARQISVADLPVMLSLEHPSGKLDIHLQIRDGRPVVSLLRTARRLFEGRLLVAPSSDALRDAIPVNS